MELSRAEFFERVEMFGGSIADIFAPAIMGIEARGVLHEAVARDFSDDRGGCDGERLLIAAHERIGRAEEVVRDVRSVDEGFVGVMREVRDSAPHGGEGGGDDADLVDFAAVCGADADLRAVVELIEGLRAQLWREFFGIVEAIGDRACFEDDGSGDDRSGERAAPDFIDASDILAGRAEFALVDERRRHRGS